MGLGSNLTERRRNALATMKPNYVKMVVVFCGLAEIVVSSCKLASQPGVERLSKRRETEPIGILVQTKESVESWATSFWGTRFPDTSVLGGSSLYRYFISW